MGVARRATRTFAPFPGSSASDSDEPDASIDTTSSSRSVAVAVVSAPVAVVPAPGMVASLGAPPSLVAGALAFAGAPALPEAADEQRASFAAGVVALAVLLAGAGLPAASAGFAAAAIGLGLNPMLPAWQRPSGTGGQPLNTMGAGVSGAP